MVGNMKNPTKKGDREERKPRRTRTAAVPNNKYIEVASTHILANHTIPVALELLPKGAREDAGPVGLLAAVRPGVVRVLARVLDRRRAVGGEPGAEGRLVCAWGGWRMCWKWGICVERGVYASKGGYMRRKENVCRER